MTLLLTYFTNWKIWLGATIAGMAIIIGFQHVLINSKNQKITEISQNLENQKAQTKLLVDTRAKEQALQLELNSQFDIINKDSEMLTNSLKDLESQPDVKSFYNNPLPDSVKRLFNN